MCKKALVFLLVVMFSGSLSCFGAAVDGLQVSITLPESGESQPSNWKAAIEFSRPVSLIELSKALSLSINGKKAEFEVVNSAAIDATPLPQPLPAERQIFVVKPRQSFSGKSSVELKLEKGVRAVDGKITLQQPVSIKFDSQPNIEIISVKPFYNSRDDKGSPLSCGQAG